MQALTRDTQVPVIMALSTIDEMSLFLDGHMEALRKEKTVTHTMSLIIEERITW